jgi:hypothetical protein
VQLAERTAPLNDAVQPAGTLPAVNVTVPPNPLIDVTVTVDVPVTVARVVIPGADREKSWMVTEMGTEAVMVPLVPVKVPVTVTVNRTPVEHVTDRAVVCVGGKVTLGAIDAVQPVGAPLAERFTVPEKLPIGVTVIVDVPGTVARVVIEAGLADTVNPETATGTFTVRDRVLGGVPVVPVTTTVNPLTGNGLQLTERVVPEIDAVQPAG